MSVVIIDFGMGNVGSIANMVKKAGGMSVVSSEIRTIAAAKKLILPGVGAFDSGMKNLTDSGIASVLNDKVLGEKIPILGICLGMQLMTKNSEEGIEKGLGWIRATTIKFNFKNIQGKWCVPHMGWNTVTVKKSDPFIRDIELDHTRFYFVHSYHVACEKEKDVLLTCNYGFDFTAAFRKENIIGVQFHPEKSHRFGMRVFRNFLSI
jgi:imidazole glycerol-phosphate synthase subunit HisH